jgi:hypothetical protein
MIYFGVNTKLQSKSLSNDPVNFNELFAAAVNGIINRQLNTVGKSSTLNLHIPIEIKFKTFVIQPLFLIYKFKPIGFIVASHFNYPSLVVGF